MIDQRFIINGKYVPELAVSYVNLYNSGNELIVREEIKSLLNKTFGENNKYNSERLAYIEKNIKSLCQMVDNYIKGTLSLKNLPLELSSLLVKLAKQMEQS